MKDPHAQFVRPGDADTFQLVSNGWAMYLKKSKSRNMIDKWFRTRYMLSILDNVVQCSTTNSRDYAHGQACKAHKNVHIGAARLAAASTQPPDLDGRVVP